MAKTASKREAAKSSDKELQKQVVSKLKGGAKLAEVASELKITPGKAAFLRMCAEVKSADRITADDDKALAKKVATARKEGNSWGRIAARAGIPEGKVKRMYEQATGKSAGSARLAGKGGRQPAKAKVTMRKRGATSKKAAGRKAGRKRGGKKAEKVNPSTAA